MSLLQFSHSEWVDNNWMVRSLTNDFISETVSELHVEIAKEFMRRKVFVGLVERFEESMIRFEQYFQWWDDWIKKDGKIRDCQEVTMLRGKEGFTHEQVPPESDEFKVLEMHNWADLKIYEFSKILFEEQESLVR